ncbi:MAG: hypothetical protein KC800_30820, partial [Candidatus Eremiobacteraeota bacterium]|nr:hypothetical protein [Candidatus Eremiobacteraeota bacterium]
MRRHFIVGFLFFAAILAWNLWHHELWRDELQAWAISRAAGGLSELFRNLEFEGHPGLWHLILYPITRFTGEPGLGLKTTQFVFALGYLALLWFRSPFSLLEKSLISGSYTLSYLYGAVSRCYAPGIFLCFLFLAYPQRIARRPWVGWLLLGLLANTHFFLAVLSFFLAILWLSLEPEPRRLLRGAWIYVVLSAVAALTVLRPNTIDGRGRFGWQDDFSLVRLGVKFSGVGNAFLPVGGIFSHNIDDPVLPLRVGFFTGLLVLTCVGVLLWKQKGALATYFGFVSCLMLFFWLRYGGLAWH